jgi:NTP pyrophosphatase (non-canonical NTP hydrolase)
MRFDEYQDLAGRTSPADRPAIEKLTNGALGLGGEAGEVVELVKKHRYHGHALDADAVAKELGDVLWYVAEICSATGLSMEDVAQRNIDKLRARYPEGFSENRSRERSE